MNARPTLSALCLATLLACSSESESVSAVPPPPPLPGHTQDSVPAMPQAIRNPRQALQALGALGQQAKDALDKTAEQANLGPVVNWRELAGFLPDQVAGMKAKGKVDGSTNSLQGLQVTTVKRSYKGSGESGQLEIVDTSFAPFLRAPFAMAAMVQEDSSKGYKRGTQIKGQPAIVQWSESRKRSEVHVLVASRFLVNVEVDSSDQAQAETIAGMLDFAGLSAAAEKARAQAPAAQPSSP